ncbi:MAG: glycosyltransferase family 2 protein, partial [Flavobacteriaceae bacterium]|nr:glycosyltransferase family 2 protein [Flavobacteriaceae bacterium]
MDALKKKIDIELFLLCYNEQKMIPHALNYYAKFCSRITIFDNDSTDNSVELIRAFDENICILRLDSNGEHREDLDVWCSKNEAYYLTVKPTTDDSFINNFQWKGRTVFKYWYAFCELDKNFGEEYSKLMI